MPTEAAVTVDADGSNKENAGRPLRRRDRDGKSPSNSTAAATATAVRRRSSKRPSSADAQAPAVRRRAAARSASGRRGLSDGGAAAANALPAQQQQQPQRQRHHADPVTMRPDAGSTSAAVVRRRSASSLVRTAAAAACHAPSSSEPRPRPRSSGSPEAVEGTEREGSNHSAAAAAVRRDSASPSPCAPDPGTARAGSADPLDSARAKRTAPVIAPDGGRARTAKRSKPATTATTTAAKRTPSARARALLPRATSRAGAAAAAAAPAASLADGRGGATPRRTASREARLTRLCRERPGATECPYGTLQERYAAVRQTLELLRGTVVRADAALLKSLGRLQTSARADTALPTALAALRRLLRNALPPEPAARVAEGSAWELGPDDLEALEAATIPGAAAVLREAVVAHDWTRGGSKSMFTAPLGQSPLEIAFLEFYANLHIMLAIAQSTPAIHLL